ncbi:MAG: NAD(P)-dependent oxidoreductase [Defluviitaleaceae bacterium]|nr:NAD(P)-dependent oxidoreductase [Defluviitaleaceae bacterium]
MAERIGVVGLGAMGGAFAANLIKNGFNVSGFDPSESCCAALREAGGEVTTLEDVAKNCGVIILSLPSVKALEANLAVITPAAAAGTILVETSTLAVEDKVRLNRTLESSGIIMLDSPVSGNGARAKNADISIYLSGDEAAAKQVIPIVQAFSNEQDYLGEFGNGMKMKCATNMMVAIHIAAAAEGMLLATRYGLPAQMAHSVLMKSGASSMQLKSRGPSMVDQKFTPAKMSSTLFLKDLGIIQDALEATGLKASMFEAALNLYHETANAYPEEDTAAVYNVINKMG